MNIYNIDVGNTTFIYKRLKKTEQMWIFKTWN